MAWPSCHVGCDLTAAVCLPQVIYLKKTPEEAYRALLAGSNPPYLPFRYSAREGGPGRGRPARRLAPVPSCPGGVLLLIVSWL